MPDSVPETRPRVSDDPFRLLLDEIGACIFATDLEGRYTYANRLVLDLVGRPLDEVLGKRFADFFGEHASAQSQETDARVLRDGETITCEESNDAGGSGAQRTYWTIKKPLRDSHGTIVGMLGVSYDITEKKQLEDTVCEQKAMLDAILTNVDALVYMKSSDRRFLYANQQVADAIGLPLERVIGRRDVDVLPAEVADAFWEKDQRIFASGTRHAGEETLIDANGHKRHYWSVVVPCTAPDGQNALIGLSTDITDLHALKEELQRQATTDALTGIANRRRFFEQAEREFAQCRQTPRALSLLAFDIDHFKHINDTFGHAVGDYVLQDFVNCARRELRPGDLFARTGGEEFCVLLGDAELDAAHAVAERIREMTAACPVLEEHHHAHITVSIGVVTLEPSDGSFGNMMVRADRALYIAKDSGRNRSVVLKADAPQAT
ncbi:MAG TPA: diguanylate cyclase [Chiayiivirga sp.]|nr:diguanylate cyclase [Chiayiivirga sp.]